ncbi:hypothetical protein ROTAS13_04459 [Roseomonas sp. TAS13]|nr:hypothetical protein ROTAS13_04459 [Roseomonas sp. TAS13]
MVPLAFSTNIEKANLVRETFLSHRQNGRIRFPHG